MVAMIPRCSLSTSVDFNFGLVNGAPQWGDKKVGRVGVDISFSLHALGLFTSSFDMFSP